MSFVYNGCVLENTSLGKTPRSGSRSATVPSFEDVADIGNQTFRTFQIELVHGQRLRSLACKRRVQFVGGLGTDEFLRIMTPGQYLVANVGCGVQIVLTLCRRRLQQLCEAL